MNTIKHDYHMHSDISPDSNAPMMSMCEKAVELGLKEIAFTEHFEYMDMGRDNSQYSSPARLKRYEDNLAKCREKFKNQLFIARAVEIGSPHLEFGRSRALIKEMNYDYVLSSVHKMDEGSLTHLVFTEENHFDLIESYYQHLLWMVQLCDYDCIAHFDMVKRHTCSQGISDERQKFWPIIEKILRTLISRGGGIEINTSGLRQSPKDTMPGLDILNLYHGLGGHIVTIGADAHRPEDIADGFDTAAQYLAEAGFSHYTIFHNRKPIDISL